MCELQQFKMKYSVFLSSLTMTFFFFLSRYLLIYDHQTAISFSERQDFHTQWQIHSGNHVVFNLEKPRRSYRLF